MFEAADVVDWTETGCALVMVVAVASSLSRIYINGLSSIGILGQRTTCIVLRPIVSLG